VSARLHWKTAIVRGGSWRYLLVFVGGTLLSSLLSFVPLRSFFGELFDHSPRAGDLVSTLDSRALIDVVRQLGERSAAGIAPGLVASVIVALALAPALTGAAAAVAASEHTLSFAELLAGAGRLYPRMARMFFVSLLPVGVAAFLSALILKAVDKSNAHVTLESSASRRSMLAWIATLALVWLATATVDMGRAYLAADPKRTGAFRAWLAGIRLLARRPAFVLATCAATTAGAFALAGLLTSLRIRLLPGGGATIVLAFVLAELAVGAVGWGRASRLTVLVAIIRETARQAETPAEEPTSSGEAVTPPS
jgi:hypothetical protein